MKVTESISNRALQYNQDMKAAEKNIALGKRVGEIGKTEYKPKLPEQISLYR